MRMVLGLFLTAVIGLGACSDDPEVEVVSGSTTPDDVVESSEPLELDSSTMTVEDSCGMSFTVRNPLGTKRLTIVPSPDVREGGEPGVFDLGEGGWEGELEVGAGLDVWPCHDIGSDFDGERVAEVWTVVGGSVELIDQIPVDDSGGGGAGPVNARIVEMIIEAPDGRTARMADIDLLNPSWGFFGG